MNILQVGSYLYPDLVGGAEISAQNVYLHLTSAGHRVVRLRWAPNENLSLATKFEKASEGEWLAKSWRPNTPIEIGSKISKSIFYGMEFSSQSDRKSLKDLVREEAIDRIVIHSFRGLGYDSLKAFADTGVPLCIFLHDLATVCMNKSMVRKSVPCQSQCAQCKIVSAQTVSAISRAENVAFIGPSRQIVDTVSTYLGRTKASFHHIPNPNRYAITPRVRLAGDGSFTVGFVGRLETEKGIEGLLGVIDDVHRQISLRMRIAGAGSLAAEVESFAAARDWVDYLGFVQPGDMPQVYDSLDCLVVPSLWPENFPGVAVQSITSGAPVIGFAIGGIGEIVQSGSNGSLFAPGDFVSVASALVELGSQPEHLASMSRNAIESAKRYAPEALGARIVQAIEAV